MFSSKKIEEQNQQIINMLNLMAENQQKILAGLYVIGQDVEAMKEKKEKETTYFG